MPLPESPDAVRSGGLTDRRSSEGRLGLEKRRLEGRLRLKRVDFSGFGTAIPAASRSMLRPRPWRFLRAEDSRLLTPSWLSLALMLLPLSRDSQLGSLPFSARGSVGAGGCSVGTAVGDVE
jgi:hypothetical protein